MTIPKGDPRFVAIRVTCRACGDNRKVGTAGLYTFPEDDGEAWYDGVGLDPARFHSSVTFRCRAGHNVPMRLAVLLPMLERMRDEVGVNGRRVVSEAL